MNYCLAGSAGVRGWRCDFASLDEAVAVLVVARELRAHVLVGRASAFEIFPSLLVSRDSKVAPFCCGGESGAGGGALCAKAPAIGSKAASARDQQVVSGYLSCRFLCYVCRDKRGNRRANALAAARRRQARRPNGPTARGRLKEVPRMAAILALRRAAACRSNYRSSLSRCRTIGGSGGIRTHDQRLKRALLYR